MRSLLVLFVLAAACSASTSNPGARVDSVSASLESRTYADVSITFENSSASECRVAKYVVSWPASAERTGPSGEVLELARPAGTKTIEPAAFVLPARSSTQRRVRIDELGTTMPTASQLSVDVTCR